VTSFLADLGRRRRLHADPRLPSPGRPRLRRLLSEARPRARGLTSPCSCPSVCRPS
jgi:hypothetical protein